MARRNLGMHSEGVWVGENIELKSRGGLELQSNVSEAYILRKSVLCT